MQERGFKMLTRRVACVALTLTAVVTVAAPISSGSTLESEQEAVLRDSDSLPDWSGVWARRASPVFDEETWTMNGEPADPNIRAYDVNTPGTRAHPPYTEEWEGDLPASCRTQGSGTVSRSAHEVHSARVSADIQCEHDCGIHRPPRTSLGP